MKNISLALIFFAFLGNNFAQDQDLVINTLLRGNIDGLNPVVSKSATSSEVLENNVFVGLMVMNKDNYKLEPYLAASNPKLKTNSKGLSLSYEIREAAKWDNGSPITAQDVLFTIKTILCPKINNKNRRSFFTFVERVDIDKNNPRKFTIHCNKQYILAESVLGLLSILPAYHYDKEGVLQKYDIPKLKRLAEKEAKIPADISDFGAAFNHQYNYAAPMISGAGPYRVVDIKNYHSVQLQRKKDWWGDQFNETQFTANPKVINYSIIEDPDLALSNLRTGELDVIPYLPEEQYLELQANPPKNSKPIHFETVLSFSYRYIGMNLRKPALSDKKVRKALAHLVDMDYVINELSNGLANRSLGPISSLKSHYNKNLEAIPFDLDKAIQLLNEADWYDTDNDGILDKMIQGEKVDLRLNVLYPFGKPFYKGLALELQKVGKEVGIDFVLMPSEWSVMLQDIMHRNFDLTILGWSATPDLDDLTQIWHSNSDHKNGSNSIGFGTKKSDHMIENIRITLDEKKRTKLYHEIQAIIYEEQPYIFLVSPQQIIAHNANIKGNCFSSLRPLFHPRFCEK